MGVPFTFGVGHTVVLSDRHGRETRYHVRAVKADGWLFEPYGQEGVRQFHSGEEVRRLYLAQCMEYLPFDDDVIPEARRRRLRREFMAQSEELRDGAVRKLAILRACERAMADGTAKGTALRTVPAEVLKERGGAWHARDVERAKDAFNDRDRRGLLGPGETFAAPAPRTAPGERTVWGWIRDYVESGRSVSSLVDSHVDKGRRESQLTAGQDAVLEKFFETHLKRNGGFVMAAAYKQLCNDAEAAKVKKIGRRTFKRRLERERDRRGLVRLEKGARAARNVGRVFRRAPTPLHPLHQVEADHTLINARVEDDETGINLGRPWLSAFRDRLSGLPLGMHISFLPPSWATLSRAVAHSMWPKDLSGHPGIRNSWDAEGVFDEAYTDRGMDFISDASRWAAAQMAFEFLNLPGYSPWLKGGLERWNREVKAEILTYRDGIASFNDPEFKGRNQPTIRLSELKAGLLSWVVDDYAQGEHGELEGISRSDVWRMELDRHGPPRPVRDFDRFRRMMMIPARRTIQKRGVEVGGFFFRDEHGRLAELLKRHDAPDDYMILIDPWDTGYIELLAHGEFIVCLNERKDMAGVTRQRCETYWRHAGQAHPGRRLTLDDFERSMEAVDADEQRVLALGARVNRRGSQNLLGMFRDLGDFMTPVPLRRVRPEPAPIVLPGLVEAGGIIRLASRPEPLVRVDADGRQVPWGAGVGPGAAGTPEPSAVLRSGRSGPDGGAGPPAGAVASRRGGGTAPATGANLLAGLAAAAKARARSFGA